MVSIVKIVTKSQNQIIHYYYNIFIWYRFEAMGGWSSDDEYNSSTDSYDWTGE